MNNEELFHYGTPHVGLTPHSGRYKYHTGDKWEKGKYKEGSKYDMDIFLDTYRALKDEGISDSVIAGRLDMTVNEFRKKRSICLAAEHAAVVARARRLRDHGNSLQRIGEIIGGKDTPIGESTIRGWLKQSDNLRKDKIDSVTNVLEEKVKKGQILDVGKGSNLYLNVTETTFETALKALKDKGYVVDNMNVEQPNSPGNWTTVKYLAPPGTTKREAWAERANIQLITEFSPNKGLQFQPMQPPSSVSLDRVKIVYKEDGGEDRDGMIGIRRNVSDLSLGNSLYSQVRIAVDDKYYIKGMAIYQDDIPKGYDIVVYSNKSKEAGVNKALKPIDRVKNPDPLNPFGAVIKAPTAGGQNYYKDPNGKYVKDGDIYILAKKNSTGDRYSLSPINKIKDEEDWESYKKSLPAQFLSKQSLQLIQRQLNLTYKAKQEEYDELMSLTNPVVKQKLLEDFAEGLDKTAKHLDAAALPRQNSKVIIPVPELKDTEIYAPSYKNGEQLALIRYPHAGTFEIPIVTVNNRNVAAKSLLGNAIDAVGINKTVADRLSGADFDGDVVVTIPISESTKILSTKQLDKLKGFDPKESYPKYEGMKVISSKQKQIQMGVVTNLITDMSLQNATPDEMARAVRHSMVIIDAEKHELNWKQSEIDNGIEALKMKYQKQPEKKKGYGGSTTLLSKLGNATITVPEIQLVDAEGNKIYTKADPTTGKKIYAETGRTYDKIQRNKTTGEVKYDSEGNPVKKTIKYTTKVSPLDLVDDAMDLVSTYKTPQEVAYANYINKMRALANQARKEAYAIKAPAKDPVAAKNYAEEVESLKDQLAIANKNKPLERKAQLVTSKKIEILKETSPYLFEQANKDKLKKMRNKALTESRLEVGAGKKSITISDREWEAIQARAIAPTTLKAILNNANMDIVRNLATPYKDVKLSDARISRIKALSSAGISIADIAEQVGCSTSTVTKYLKD